MSRLDFIIELFCRVDERLVHLPKHPQANLFPGEVVTLALLRSIKGVSDQPTGYKLIQKHLYGKCA